MRIMTDLNKMKNQLLDSKIVLINCLNDKERQKLLDWCFEQVLGNSYIMNCIGNIYLFQWKDQLAIDFLVKSANAGNGESMFDLGYYYEKKRDIAAFEWYKKGAENGEIKSICNLGAWYRLHGPDGCEDDMVKLFLKAGAAGRPNAYYNLAKTYATGFKTIRINTLMAAKYYHRALKMYITEENILSCQHALHSLLVSGSEISELFEKIESLETENEELKTELDLRPGGSLALKAEENFYKAAQKI